MFRPDSCMQAAREIAATISSANNRVYLTADSLLLNLVRLFAAACFLLPALAKCRLPADIMFLFAGRDRCTGTEEEDLIGAHSDSASHVGRMTSTASIAENGTLIV